MAFEIAFAGYQNQQENLHFVQLPVKQEKIDTDEVVEVAECPPEPTTTATTKTKKYKIKS